MLQRIKIHFENLTLWVEDRGIGWSPSQETTDVEIKERQKHQQTGPSVHSPTDGSQKHPETRNAKIQQLRKEPNNTKQRHRPKRETIKPKRKTSKQMETREKTRKHSTKITTPGLRNRNPHTPPE
jgi:hypothetical protein